MANQNLPVYRFTWDKIIIWCFSGAFCLPFLSAVFFSFLYNQCRRRGLDFYWLFGPADESAGIGVIFLCLYHAPLGFILSALSAYCYGAAQQNFARRAYLVSHWFGLLLSVPLLLLTAFYLMGASKGWVLSAFLCGFPLLGALSLLALSYKFRREMRRSS